MASHDIFLIVDFFFDIVEDNKSQNDQSNSPGSSDSNGS